MIGIFDSGLGGLSVWREIATRLPHEDSIYFADQSHCPYGARSLDEIRRLSEGIVRFLVSQGANLVVVACNTASAAALYGLRELFDNPIVGMEPAVKPAAELTVNGIVGVMATPATFEGEPFSRLMSQFAQDVTVIQKVCPGLVQCVEAGGLAGPQVEALLSECLTPMVDQSADVVVLGCTHYPFLLPSIEKVVGDGVQVIDPARAVAKQVERVLDRDGLRTASEFPGQHRFYTSGDPVAFNAMLQRLTGQRASAMRVVWTDAGAVAEGSRGF